MQFIVKVVSIDQGKTLFIHRFSRFEQAYEFYLMLNGAVFFERVCVKLLTADYELISLFESRAPDQIKNL
ncbi:hypothetical protein FHS56_001672 [Thermonema lapsum]|jgi:hypothetical protein|uniref:Uncharacterized protein n=1 Tax=Thermonema lapsum TaxID=28195 RepID=A0A846MRS4_9BACT|nr:hypothetical protein [Thermonema lapsum]NIK74159.1 hypothetical protein [Thermonema lapsum]